MIPVLMSKRFNGLAHEEESTACCFCYIPKSVPNDSYGPPARPPRAADKKMPTRTPAVIVTRPSIIPDKLNEVQSGPEAPDPSIEKQGNKQEILNPNDINISFIPIEGNAKKAVNNTQSPATKSRIANRIQNTFKPFRGKYSIKL